MSEERKIDSICLYLTTHCNMRCEYCFLDWRDDFRNKSMDQKTLFNAIDMLVDEKTSGRAEELVVGLFGGEPLMAFDLIDNVIHYAGNIPAKKVHFALVTNGLLLSDDLLDYFANNDVSITLSCDGDEKSQNFHRKTASREGSYGYLIHNLGKIAVYPDIKVRITYSAETAATLSANVKFLYQQGFRHIGFSNVDGLLIGQELADVIEREIRAIGEFWIEAYKRGDPFWVSPLISFFQHIIDASYPFHIHMHQCEAGEHDIAVDPDGNIFPCYRFAALNKFYLGNVSAGGINFLLLGDFLSRRKRNAEGCLAVNLLETGDIGNPHQAVIILRAIYFKIAQELFTKLPEYLRSLLIHSNEYRLLLKGKIKVPPPIERR